MSETRDKAAQDPADQDAPRGSTPAGDPEPAAQGAEGSGEAPAVDLEALAGEAPDAEEDGLDLRDLEELGVDGVVARLRHDEGAQPAEPPRRPRRSPLVAPVVVLLGAYLLVSMFADFRYWLRSEDPVDLGHASTLLQDGRTLEPYENQYVVIQGTPDVQYAARLTTKEQYVGYLRVSEGGGGLFASIPRPKDQPATDSFEGRYVGRLRPLGEDRAFEWLKQFYANQQVTEVIDLDSDGALAALPGTSLPAADGTSLEVGTLESLRLVFMGSDARVQLDKSVFPTAQEAEQAVAALGYPYLVQSRVKRGATQQGLLGGEFHRFVVRIPADAREDARRKLNEGKVDAESKVGAIVLDLPATYVAPAGEVRVEGDQIAFPYGDNTTSLGYDVVDGKLVERAREALVRRSVTELRSLRLERVITVDPNGYIVAVDEPPSSLWKMGGAFLLVLLLVLANVTSLALWWRQRAA